MAKVSDGLLGPLSGKIGPVIASSWKGIPYFKSVHKPRTTNISDKEKANREKFKQAQAWLKPLLEFVRLGFKGYTKTVEGFSAAKSYLMKNALDTEGRIDPSKVKLSWGSLALPDNISVERAGEKKLQFNWNYERGKGVADRDQVMLMAYDIKNAKANYTIAGEFREAGTAMMDAPCDAGASCHVWLAFVAADRRSQSDSIYLGEVQF